MLTCSPQSRAWIGTSFEEISFEDKDIEYAIWQKEQCPTTNKIHTQFFVYFYKKKRFQGVQRITGKAHIEIARNIPKSIEYCSKNETRVEGPFEKGVRPKLSLIENGTVIDSVRKRGIVETIIDNPKLWRNVRQLKEIEDLFFAPRSQAPSCLLFTGETGVGKSRLVMAIASYVGLKDVYFKANNKWWDQYRQQKLVIWDEFRGEETLPVSEVLMMINHVPWRVERKGGSVEFRSDWIFLTSNISLDQMYSRYSEVTRKAIKRRIREIKF